MAIRRYKVNPSVTASSAYDAYDVVGGLLKFDGLRNGTLQSISICDNAAQNVNYVIVLFDSIVSVINDKDEFDISDAALDEIIFIGGMAAATYRWAFKDNSIHLATGLSVPLSSAGGSVYGFLVTTSTPTYAATSDITVTLQVKDFDTVKAFEV